MRRVVFVLLLILLAPVAVRCEPPARTLAITIDDLPYIPGAGQATAAGSLADARRATEAILGALTRHKAPAVGFVNEVRLQVPGERDARVELLKRWVNAGMVLGNHTFSHSRLQDTPPERYEDDIIRGDVVTRQLMEGRGAPLFFRYPYNSTGATKEIKEGIQSFLSARGYRLAPFTVEHADYLFDKIRWAAREKGDRDLEARTRSAYLAHLDTMLDFAERLSRETFGREIPQVLLIHASDLNADCLDEMLVKMEKRGYRFISLEEALKDPAFATPDEYVGPAGISWLHRWSVSLGLPMKLRDEPDPPQWVLDLYKNVS
jgi:peptidoglycan/xylan/chitin deacetylase (PgdA/CDA1 family)